MKVVSLFFLCLFSISTFAVSKFTKYGEISSIKYRPVNSPLKFDYDVLYYIPAKLKGKKDLSALVFLHGGGASTSTRSSSFNIAKMYMEDLKSVADNLGVVLIGPSGSGQNWGSHLLAYLRDLNYTLRTELPINPNKIALSGHSMGGMGITRSAQWLTDEYSFFMPVAAGMDEKGMTDEYLMPLFNTTYYHMQGLNDHFQVFVERCKIQKDKMLDLERTVGQKSGFKLEFYNGSHNYPKSLYEMRLKELFYSTSRNLYQKSLTGVFYNRNEILEDQWSNGNKYYLAPRDSYFWLKAKEFSIDKKVIVVKANITNNIIDIKLDNGIKTLTVKLSSKVLDLNKTVTIKVNGKVKISKLFTKSKPLEFFEDSVDIQL